MSAWIETALIAIVLTNFLLLASSRLGGCIRTVAVQGVILGVLLLFTHAGALTPRILVLAAVIVLVKGVILRRLLLRTLGSVHKRREIEPFVGYTLSILVGVASLLISMYMGARLQLPGPVASSLAVPVAFSTMLTGLFLVISRRKALTQVLGYLVAENGIFVFAVTVTHGGSLWVELGILLDVLVAVFVMGIAVHHISNEFDSIDVARISTLKG
ncbi:MAG TPA: hydrogenase [Candidatus Krumholzibacteria bacterium]|nr:hydrogenase [Candidatus Krumholzibacteria bacterium]